MSARSFVFALTICMLASCASIVSKSSWPVTITAVPPDAEVEVVNQAGKVVHKGPAPFEVHLKSGVGYFDGEKYTLNATAPGHAPCSMTLDTKVNGWFWGNIIFGGVIGFFLVDPLSGAMYSLPKTMNVTLEPVKT